MTFDANALLQAARSVAAGQQYPKGTLYLVPTPIGNLGDLSLRAVHVLELVDAVACEDTRVSGGLLRMIGLDKRLLSVHEHNESEAVHDIVARLQAGERVAYVSDAGTPAVSDPGARLVQGVIAAGLRVMPLPGPSAVTTALSAAGDAAAAGFRFIGFLPAKGAPRQQALDSLDASPESVVLFEAPHRIEPMARELAARLPNATITVCRELTKQFEGIATMPVRDFPAWLAAASTRLKGEFVLVLHAQPAATEAAGLTPALTAVLAELARHIPTKQAAALVADVCGLPRKALYEEALRLKPGSVPTMNP